MEIKTKLHNQLLFLLTLLVIVSSAAATYYLVIKTQSNYKIGQSQTADEAVRRALEQYAQKKSRGEDLRNGPCLNNQLMADWVADLVHNPRAKSDDLPSNQCKAFLDGKATHFVELDLDGNVVRVQ